MDTTRQILRYSIPGGIFLLTALMIHNAYIRWVQDGQINEAATVLDGPGQATLVALASIPIGFIIYQFYFWRYRPDGFGPFAMSGRTPVRLDRGADVLVALSPDDALALHERGIYFDATDVVSGRRGVLMLDETKVDGLRTTTRALYAPDKAIDDGLGHDDTRALLVCPVGRSTCECTGLAAAILRGKWVDYYRHRWDVNWRAVGALLLLADVQGGEHVRKEYTVLSDLYHSLGASRFAVVFAAVGTLLFESVAYHSGSIAWAYVVAVIVTTAIVWTVLAVTRAHTWRSVASFLKNLFALFGTQLVSAQLDKKGAGKAPVADG